MPEYSDPPEPPGSTQLSPGRSRGRAAPVARTTAHPGLSSEVAERGLLLGCGRARRRWGARGSLDLAQWCDRWVVLEGAGQGVRLPAQVLPEHPGPTGHNRSMRTAGRPAGDLPGQTLEASV